MKLRGRKVLVCDCEATMPLDAKALAKACGVDESVDVNTQLCRAQLENFKTAVEGGEPVLVACTQEAPLFDETAEAMKPDASVTFTNIRERAGWSEASSKATPKIAALLAEATLDIPPAPTVTLKSEGICLVYGRDESAIEAARQLAGRLDVTVLLSKPTEIIPPRITDVPIFKGTIVAAKGYLGAFEVVVNDYAPMVVSSRQSLAFEALRDGAASKYDLILDLTGDTPLFPAPEKRDGYFKPDPRNPAAVQRALFDLADMVGEFEKPRYVDYKAEICAHSRSGKIGCTRCLDVCPTSAIRPNGDYVEIDPYICAGCGSCASVCPTGAASYALPPATSLLERLHTLLTTFYKAGGERPVVLVHDARHGEEMISMMARYSRGLPANVLPFAVNEVTQIGFDFLAAALAYGASQVLMLVGPEKKEEELSGLAGQIGLAEAAMVGLGYGSGRVSLATDTDPETVEAALYDLPELEPATPGTFLPMGGNRTLATLALQHLHEVAPTPVDILPLPPGAPFGTIKIDTEGCTLCLACVGACPTGAILDNPDKPQVSVTEGACVQCGLCENTCPEQVITLEPRFNFTEAARGAVILNQEEPFNCIRCGKPFGTKSSIDRVIEQLAGKHWMFQDSAAIDRIKMCDDCRVIAQSEAGTDPYGGPPRPDPRTTDDYLREREIEEAQAKVRAERKGA